LREIKDYKTDRDGRLHIESRKGNWDFYAAGGGIDRVWQALAERISNASGQSATQAASEEETVRHRGPSREVAIPHRTEIVVVLDAILSTHSNDVGDRFWGRLADPIKVKGSTVAKTGSRVAGYIRDIKEDVRGAEERSSMTLHLDTIETVGGEQRVFAESMLRNSNPRFDVPTYMKITFTILTRPGE
jgi:hypothetical protein